MFDLLWLCLDLVILHEICTILKQDIFPVSYRVCNSVIFLGHTTHFVKVRHLWPSSLIINLVTLK